MAERIPTRLTAQLGRRFGVSVGGAFAVLAGLLWWRDHDVVAAILGSVGGLLVVGGLVAPTKLGPIERAWMGFAHGVSKITTPILMGILYFLVIAPMGFVMRLFGRNPLTSIESDGSFWVSRADEDSARGGMTHQF